jgi:hypothetical protein
VEGEAGVTVGWCITNKAEAQTTKSLQGQHALYCWLNIFQMFDILDINNDLFMHSSFWYVR